MVPELARNCLLSHYICYPKLVLKRGWFDSQVELKAEVIRKSKIQSPPFYIIYY